MNLDLAYLAGYTDGDGCFHIRESSKKFRNTFVISSTNKTVLDHFQYKFGGNVRFVRQIRKEKSQYHFIVEGAKANDLIKSFSKFLIEKKEESELFAWFFETSDKQEKWLTIKDMKMSRLKGLAKPQDKFDIEKKANSINPTEENFAYLAGFIDAECCLGLQRYKAKGKNNWLYKSLLQCNNTRSQSIRLLVSIFGGNVHFIKRRTSTTNLRDQITWRLSSQSLAKILPKIYPYLITKKAVCEQLMKFSKTIIPLEKTPSRNSSKFQEFYEPIYVQREEIFNLIHQLNHKGL